MKYRRLLASVVTHDGVTAYNAVVTFSPGELPSIEPLTGEPHSTAHVNGLVHFGDIRGALQTAGHSPLLTLTELAGRLAPLSEAVSAPAWLLEITPQGVTATPLP